MKSSDEKAPDDSSKACFTAALKASTEVHSKSPSPLFEKNPLLFPMGNFRWIFVPLLLDAQGEALSREQIQLHGSD